jgi:uncharacterized protein (DUF2062 family)/predicted TPR repeat methyltransferase
VNAPRSGAADAARELDRSALGTKSLRERFRLLWRKLRGGSLSPLRAGASVALGLFIGSLPLYGLHLPLCLLLCLPLRLDVVVAYLAANVSNPFVAPFLVTAEIEVGSLLLTGATIPFDVEQARRTGITGFVLQAALGSLVVGSALAVVGGALAYAIANRRRAREVHELSRAIRRTVARYAQAPIADRLYVSSKLANDPIVGKLAALPGSFGSVVDAGCGRGQLGLLLLELGGLERLRGFDWDSRKVAIAERAASGDARFETGDLRAIEWTLADTVLLIDVLHYLPRAEQDALLGRVVEALAPGGRLVVREVDGERGWRSGLTTLFERMAARIRYNRAHVLDFRPAAQIRARLEALGLTVTTESASDGTPLANVMIVAVKGEAAAGGGE